MCRILFRIIFGLWLLGNVVLAQAATLPPGFNIATIPVTSQSPTDLHNAMVKAFSQVLVKISGNSQILTTPAIQAQLANPEKFSQKYSYLGGNAQITFDERALITLLAEAQQPVWLSARPTTLIWLSMNGQAPGAASTEFQSSADGRAIPIAFPNMTPDDQADWKAKTNGAAFDQSSLEKIAARYQQPAILYGEFTQTDANWNANWTFVWRGQIWQWHDAGSQPGWQQAAIDKIADIMGGQLAVNLNQQDANSNWLAVMGVSNLTDYLTVLNTLKQFPAVLGVVVQDVGSKGLLLQVTTMGQGADTLKSALDANPHFAVLSSTDTQALHYQWKP